MQDDLEPINSQDLLHFSQESFGDLFSCSLGRDYQFRSDEDPTFGLNSDSQPVSVLLTNGYSLNSQQPIITFPSDSSPLPDNNSMDYVNNVTNAFHQPSTSTASEFNNYNFEYSEANMNNSYVECIPQQIYIADPVMQLAVPIKPACLPASNNWLGSYGFDVYFENCDEQAMSKKRDNWKYSVAKDKLYVKRCEPCPINFVTTANVPDGSTISVMLIFIQPCDGYGNVSRCLLHKYEDEANGMQSDLANHIVRCECDQAYYNIDPMNGNRVTVPFSTPGVDRPYVTYIFKFACFSSCDSGINRRAVKIVFTLETGGVIVGRRSLELKICACVQRDFKNDHQEKDAKKPNVKFDPTKTTNTKKTKEGNSKLKVGAVLDFVSNITDVDKSKTKDVKIGKKYHVKIDDVEEFEFLCGCKQMFRTRDIVRQSSSSDEDSSQNNE